jgi:hypothetical protein
MTIKHDDPKVCLARLLGGLAMYNDKGFIWAGHSPEKVNVEIEEMKRKIQLLVDEIGPKEFPDSLLASFRSSAILGKDDGELKDKVEKLFGLLINCRGNLCV